MPPTTTNHSFSTTRAARPCRADSPPTPTAIDDRPQTASVFFKNMIKRCWEPEEEDGKENAIAEADKVVIKANMVNYMCTTPPEVQRQLSEALSIISKSDFPAKWQVRGPGLHAQTRRRCRRRCRRRRRGDALGRLSPPIPTTTPTPTHPPTHPPIHPSTHPPIHPPRHHRSCSLSL